MLEYASENGHFILPKIKQQYSKSLNKNKS